MSVLFTLVKFISLLTRGGKCLLLLLWGRQLWQTPVWLQTHEKCLICDHLKLCQHARGSWRHPKIKCQNKRRNLTRTKCLSVYTGSLKHAWWAGCWIKKHVRHKLFSLQFTGFPSSLPAGEGNETGGDGGEEDVRCVSPSRSPGATEQTRSFSSSSPIREPRVRPNLTPEIWSPAS